MSAISVVAVGFSEVLLASLDRLVAPGSVLVVEDAGVVRARDARRRAAAHPCVAGLVEAPVQREDDQSAVLAAVDRPPAVRAVLPAIEYAVVTAAVLADEWRVPGAGAEAARILRNKAALRRTAGRAGLPQPRWRLVTGVEQAREFRASLGGACVLKPATRQASLGVQLLGTGDDLAAGWERLIGADEPRLRGDGLVTDQYLIEERLRGPEVSVEMLVDGGRPCFSNVCAKQVLTGSSPVEIGHQVPAPLRDEIRERLVGLTAQLAGAVDFRSGVLHAEWILRDGAEPHLVECAGRLPGDRIVTLIDLAYDMRLTGEWLAILQGSPGAPPVRARQGAAVRFLTAGASGVISAIDGIEMARSAPGVYDVQVTAQVGAAVTPVACSWDRLGNVLAVGDDAATAASRARRAADLIEIRTVAV